MLIRRALHEKIASFIDSREAIVITGMRRVGKTTLLKMIFDEIASKNKLFLDLENPFNQQLFSEKNYDIVLDNLQSLGLSSQEKGYVFLDEIQNHPQIPSVIKYLSDHYDLKFFLSGSASFYIKNLFSESLSGRKYLFELFPFSFKEFLLAKNVPLPPQEKNITETTHQFYDRFFNEYLLYGGFPGVVTEPSTAEKVKKIEDIFSSYWSLEVEKLSDFRKKDRVRDFISLLMQRVGSKIDISKLSRELGIAKDTVSSYLSFLEDTYLVSTISPFSTNRDTEIRSAKKPYFIDPGLLRHFANLDDGAIFENCCYNLLRHHGKVQYYQRKNGVEIDFILNKTTAFEVKLSAQKHHYNSLARLCQSINLKNCQVISKKYSTETNTAFGFLL